MVLDMKLLEPHEFGVTQYDDPFRKLQGDDEQLNMVTNSVFANVEYIIGHTVKYAVMRWIQQKVWPEVF